MLNPILGKIWITDGTEEKMIFSNELIDPAWYKGRCTTYEVSDAMKQQSSIRMKQTNPAKGYKRTDAEKKAISERMKGNTHFANARRVSSMQGKKHSEETKQKMRAAALKRYGAENE